MNSTEPWPDSSIDSKTVLENLQEQMERFREEFPKVPREFAGTPGSVSRFWRRIRAAVGEDSITRPTDLHEALGLRLFGIPIVEDEDVPEGQIRIRYGDGRESVIYLE